MTRGTLCILWRINDRQTIVCFVSDQTQTGGVSQRTESKRNRIVADRPKPNDPGECLPAVVQRKNLENLLQNKIYIYMKLSLKHIIYTVNQFLIMCFSLFFSSPQYMTICVIILMILVAVYQVLISLVKLSLLILISSSYFISSSIFLNQR